MFLNDVKNVDSKLKVFSSENIQYSIDYHIDIKSVKRDKEKKLQILNKRRESLESKLNNQQFITKAPDNIVKASKNELKNIQNEILEVKKALDSL